MFTILGIGIGIGLLIRLIVFISDEQQEKKKQNELNNIKIQLMNSFLSGLAQYSKKSYQKIDNIENGKIYINSEIKEYCDKVSLDNEIKRTFGELQRLLVNITTQYVCWSITNRSVNNYYPIDSLDLKRDEIININDDLIIEDLFAGLSLVKLSIGNKFVAFTPYFIFIIDSNNQNIKFIDWKDVKANKDGNIKIKERRTVKNVNPIGYSWKHERINGGPDLRYRNNPRWPIINYNILEIKTKSVKYWLIPDLFSCTALDNKIKEYVSKILSVTNTYPSVDSNNNPPKSVNENLPQKNKNEEDENFKIALAIKELKNENPHLLMEEKIYYALNDYLVFKNNPVEKKIFQMVVSEGYYTKLFNTKTDSKEADKLLKEIVIQFDKAHDFDFAKIENIILNIAIGLEKINNNRLECLGNSKNQS